MRGWHSGKKIFRKVDLDLDLSSLAVTDSVPLTLIVFGR